MTLTTLASNNEQSRDAQASAMLTKLNRNEMYHNAELNRR
jgi:hypothetical protein